MRHSFNGLQRGDYSRILDIFLTMIPMVVQPLFGAAPVLQAAVMTMFVLPPPFVIPLFMREPEGPDRTFVVNALSLATLVTLVAFTVITVVYRP